LNSTLFRKLLSEFRAWQEKGVEIDLVCIGQKASAFFRRLKINMLASVTHLGEQPQLEKLIGVVKVMLDSYTDGRVDRVQLCYNDFVNTMTQRVTVEALLPLPPSDSLESKHDWDYLYEPDAETVLNDVMTRYVESLVYQAVLENLASEHAARMVAMKSASDNANKLIDTLNLIYNKARQAAITQEISEIVGGAAAV
jgi:F-type H+-transporting ATPase subunit gamma